MLRLNINIVSVSGLIIDLDQVEAEEEAITATITIITMLVATVVRAITTITTTRITTTMLLRQDQATEPHLQKQIKHVSSLLKKMDQRVLVVCF